MYDTLTPQKEGETEQQAEERQVSGGIQAIMGAHGVKEGIKGTGGAEKFAGEELNAANKDFKKAIPATKTNPYTDNDLVVANNYLEPQHTDVEPIRSVQHTVDALNSSIEGIENKISEAVNIIPNEPITTNVLNDVKSALEKNERGDEFVNAGMKEIEGLNLDNVNMSRADAVRRQLNLENKAILKKNNYDLAAARAADPGFAAREAAAASLRKGIYDQFKEHGIEGSEELRQEEGSLLKVRDAAQAQIFNGDKVIKGSGGGTLGRRMAGRGVQAVTTAIGAGMLERDVAPVRDRRDPHPNSSVDGQPQIAVLLADRGVLGVDSAVQPVLTVDLLIPPRSMRNRVNLNTLVSLRSSLTRCTSQSGGTARNGWYSA